MLNWQTKKAFLPHISLFLLVFTFSIFNFAEQTFAQSVSVPYDEIVDADRTWAFPNATLQTRAGKIRQSGIVTTSRIVIQGDRVSGFSHVENMVSRTIERIVLLSPAPLVLSNLFIIHLPADTTIHLDSGAITMIRTGRNPNLIITTPAGDSTTIPAEKLWIEDAGLIKIDIEDQVKYTFPKTVIPFSHPNMNGTVNLTLAERTAIFRRYLTLNLLTIASTEASKSDSYRIAVKLGFVSPQVRLPTVFGTAVFHGPLEFDPRGNVIQGEMVENQNFIVGNRTIPFAKGWIEIGEGYDKNPTIKGKLSETTEFDVWGKKIKFHPDGHAGYIKLDSSGLLLEGDTKLTENTKFQLPEPPWRQITFEGAPGRLSVLDGGTISGNPMNTKLDHTGELYYFESFSLEAAPDSTVDMYNNGVIKSVFLKGRSISNHFVTYWWVGIAITNG